MYKGPMDDVRSILVYYSFSCTRFPNTLNTGPPRLFLFIVGGRDGFVFYLYLFY